MNIALNLKKGSRNWGNWTEMKWKGKWNGNEMDCQKWLLSATVLRPSKSKAWCLSKLLAYSWWSYKAFAAYAFAPSLHRQSTDSLIKKDQKFFRVQILFQVMDLGLYAADLHETKPSSSNFLVNIVNLKKPLHFNTRSLFIVYIGPVFRLDMPLAFPLYTIYRKHEQAFHVKGCGLRG